MWIEGLIKLSSELRRKALHLVCVMAIFLLLNLVSSWQIAVISVVGFALGVYPILALLERFPQYARFFVQRRKGEVKMSLILICLMVATLTIVFWGWLGGAWKYIVIVAVLAWGYGDAAACLVGKIFGRHYIEHRLVEGKKTVEGTIAMLIVSGLAVFYATWKYTSAAWYLCLGVALLVAPICAIVELFSLRGTDTITVPFSAAIATFAFTHLLTSMGA